MHGDRPSLHAHTVPPVARGVILVCCMTEVTLEQLDTVLGGQNPPSPETLGRCGPDNGWQFLGNVRTPECAAHDRVVRDALANGSSQLGAQIRGLPLLPAAIGSYFRERFK